MVGGSAVHAPPLMGAGVFLFTFSSFPSGHSPRRDVSSCLDFSFGVVSLEYSIILPINFLILSLITLVTTFEICLSKLECAAWRTVKFVCRILLMIAIPGVLLVLANCALMIISVKLPIESHSIYPWPCQG